MSKRPRKAHTDQQAPMVPAPSLHVCVLIEDTKLRIDGRHEYRTVGFFINLVGVDEVVDDGAPSNDRHYKHIANRVAFKIRSYESALGVTADLIDRDDLERLMRAADAARQAAKC